MKKSASAIHRIGLLDWSNTAATDVYAVYDKKADEEHTGDTVFADKSDDELP